MQKHLFKLLGWFMTILFLMSATPNAQAGGDYWEQNWAMAGANPQRTSWVSEEVRGKLVPVWYKPFEPYISQKVQVIAAEGKLFMSTARGLYALNAATGAELWVYPTEMPLGHSPTVYDGVAYVGGFDNKLHAIDVADGSQLWTFEAEAGFHTNPLVVNGVVYAGNRDGRFYAIQATGENAGELLWQYGMGHPILFSAAYNNNRVFFAANDNRVYALNAQTGDLVWRSERLPGAGFHSWWPTIADGKLLIAGSNNYRTSVSPGAGGNIGQAVQITTVEKDEFHASPQTRGTLIGDFGTGEGNWPAGTYTINGNRIHNYLTEKPWRRTTFMFNQSSGVMLPDPPFLWTGTHSGTRYPFVAAPNDVVYQQNHYMADPFIAGGGINGWSISGNDNLSIVHERWTAIDEGLAFSGGGDVLYYSLCCDRVIGAYDVSMPAQTFANKWNSGQLPPTNSIDNDRMWTYTNYDFDELLPGYNNAYHMSDQRPFGSFGATSPTQTSKNGVYGYHADNNPPIPYNGLVYIHRGNSIIAFGPDPGVPAQELPVAQTVDVEDEMTTRTPIQIQNMLIDEVTEILEAGHLRPAYTSHGIFDFRGNKRCGDSLVDYWSHPYQTIHILLQAIPHLPLSMVRDVENYIRAEFRDYPMYEWNHMGWAGVRREIYLTPPDVGMAGYENPQRINNDWNLSDGWTFNPFMFYVLWEYVDYFEEDPATYFELAESRWDPKPNNQRLIEMPSMLNAYIAGYEGYIKLKQAAEGAANPDPILRSELNSLYSLRRNNFTPNSAFADFGYGASPAGIAYCRTLNIANNFMYMTPEVAQNWIDFNQVNMVRNALTEYETIAPYWFVSLAEEGFAENTHAPLYDSHSLFLARAWVLNDSFEELDRYLDVPAFWRGDMFYIQKLLVMLEKADAFNVFPRYTLGATSAGNSYAYYINVEAIGTFDEPVTVSVGAMSDDLDVTVPLTPLNTYPRTVRVTLTNLNKDLAEPIEQEATIRFESESGQVITKKLYLLVYDEFQFLPIVRNR